MKMRISLTVEKNLVKNIDNFIDGLIIKSRSEAIENFLQKYLDENRYAVILAGGNPKNLWVPELNTYRPLVRINGKTLIEDIIEKVKRINFGNIIIVSSHKIILKMKEVLDEEKLKCKMTYIEEKEPKNTANTLSLAKILLRSTFLFLPCDHYFDFDLRELEKIHSVNNFTVSLALYSGSMYTWHKSSIVALNGNEIVEYWENPSKSKTLMTSTFIGFAEPKIFDKIKEEKLSLQKDVFPVLAKKRELGGAILAGNFVNVHSKKDVEIVKRLMK